MRIAKEKSGLLRSCARSRARQGVHRAVKHTIDTPSLVVRVWSGDGLSRQPLLRQIRDDVVADYPRLRRISGGGNSV